MTRVGAAGSSWTNRRPPAVAPGRVSFSLSQVIIELVYQAPSTVVEVRGMQSPRSASVPAAALGLAEAPGFKVTLACTRRGRSHCRAGRGGEHRGCGDSYERRTTRTLHAVLVLPAASRRDHRGALAPSGGWPAHQHCPCLASTFRDLGTVAWGCAWALFQRLAVPCDPVVAPGGRGSTGPSGVSFLVAGTDSGWLAWREGLEPADRGGDLAGPGPADGQT
jgi:hypothetical protein